MRTNNLKEQLIYWSSVVVVAVIFSVGISYLFAWTGPAGTPPNNNVPAPINVGPDAQTKIGNLQIGDSGHPSNITIVDGTQGAGKVLTSDENGKASWRYACLRVGEKTKQYTWHDGSLNNYPEFCGPGAPTDAWGLPSPTWSGTHLGYWPGCFAQRGVYIWGTDPSNGTYGWGWVSAGSTSTGAVVCPGDQMVYYIGWNNCNSDDIFYCSYNITSGRWVNESKCIPPGYNSIIRSVIFGNC